MSSTPYDTETTLLKKILAQLETGVTTPAALAAAVAAHDKSAGAHLRVATFSNADYAFTAGINVAQQTGTLTAARTVTLPAANSLPRGARVRVEDASGTCSPSLALALTAAGADTIGGKTSLAISTPYGSAELVTDGVSLWTVTAAGIPLGSPVMGSTRILVLPGVDTRSVSTFQPTASRIHYSPFFTDETIVIDALACEVTQAATGAAKTARIGIYSANINWQPVALVVQAEISTASNAVITTAANAVLPPGRYLLAMAVSDASGAPIFRSARGGTRWFGFDPAMGANLESSAWAAVFTYGELPAAGEAWTIQFGTTFAGQYPIFLRKVN